MLENENIIVKLYHKEMYTFKSFNYNNMTNNCSCGSRRNKSTCFNYKDYWA